ncbi:peptidoglycan DD-metalloendopeptidase family protein [Pseudomonas putida]|uniref:peptidoglycan DD-metalloendopeptidase family protein n=1 Tax=Pseudomonas putida TaxID=303 RepID=UPI002363294A|nr:peptidoglycan DD-metalloendopeptidase family protein [Pseudomonas putida]MDD1966994.1 peptidoglycan DD-metalloendopeptidase family protein [Pseudomonas putida]
MSLTVIRQRMSSTCFQRLVTGIALSFLLAGCSSSPSGGVRVVDRNDGKPSAPTRQPVTTGQYVVKRGDTLFSIAFRYGWDWKALAARNNIPEPYTIHVGQAIRFDGRSSSNSTAVATAPVVIAPSTSNTTNSPSGSIKTTVITRPVGATSGSTSTTTPPAVTAPVNTPVVAGARSPSGWAWPTSGVLIAKFSSNGSLNKGIDIAGDLGQPVLAASDGSVVYAGSGLRGYGELVIIKHSDTYVSAYGHNRRLLVREGQQVKAGQTIAEMGSTGTDRVKLHFEIRRQGKPVDPLGFLPRR